MNRDGRWDILLYRPSTGDAYSGLSNGDGTFTFISHLWSPNFDVVRLADFNGDGVMDVLLYRNDGSATYLGLGDGTGNFTFYALFFSPNYMIEVAHLHAAADGKADLILYDSAVGTVYFATNWNGSNFSQYTYNLWSPGYSRVCVADFDGDGLSDVLLYKYDGSQTVVGRQFSLPSGFVFTAGFFSPNYDYIRAGNLSHTDGKTDLVVYNSGTGLAYALLWNGTWFDGFPFYPTAGNTQMQVVDVTGDGFADLLFYSLTTGAESMYLSNGNGTFTHVVPDLSWSPGFDYVEPRDLNNDGKMDFVLYNSGSFPGYGAAGQSVGVISNGSGGFSTYANGNYGTGLVVDNTPERIGGNAIRVDSTNRVNAATPNYRWEPSSATSGNGWLTSWHDVGSVPGDPNPSVTHSFTSYWHDGWTVPVEHQVSRFGVSYSLMDTYLYWDSYRRQYALVAVDYSAFNSVWVRYTADALGASWGTMNLAMLATDILDYYWDFPSIAVNPNTGRIVVGATKINFADSGHQAGYWTAYSDDDGMNWHGPYVVGVAPQLGQDAGGTSRIVWSASGFHAFIVDKSKFPTYTLTHWQSGDGQTWTKQADIDSYTMPLISYPLCVGCGDMSYSAVPDAVSSSTLGWVVAYPIHYKHPDTGVERNAIIVSTENGGKVRITCCEPSYFTDIFNADIATSRAGDWYLTFQTYQGGDHVLPVEQAVVYRTGSLTSPAYVNAVINSSINPSQWWYYNTGNSAKCVTVSRCYTPGDWFRPAMNTSTVASVPIVVDSPAYLADPTNNINDLAQTFIHDPQIGNSQKLHVKVEPIAPGTDLRSPGVLSSELLAQISAGLATFSVSSMVYASHHHK